MKDEMTETEVRELSHAIVNQAYEYVNHPCHYGNGENDPYECFKVAEAYGWDKNAYRFTAFRYMVRAGKKPDNPIIQDLEKAVVYLQREIKMLKESAK